MSHKIYKINTHRETAQSVTSTHRILVRMGSQSHLLVRSSNVFLCFLFIARETQDLIGLFFRHSTHDSALLQPSLLTTRDDTAVRLAPSNVHCEGSNTSVQIIVAFHTRFRPSPFHFMGFLDDGLRCCLSVFLAPIFKGAPTCTRLSCTQPKKVPSQCKPGNDKTANTCLETIKPTTAIAAIDIHSGAREHINTTTVCRYALIEQNAPTHNDSSPHSVCFCSELLYTIIGYT